MKRTVFDKLMSAGGLVVVIVLLVAGGLLMGAQGFVASNVHSQLARQEIFFPPKAAFAHAKAGTEITPSMIPSVSQYAGQQLLTGPQAEVYADDFIAVHLSEMPYHGVYATISAAARAAKPGSPQATKLAALVQASFILFLDNPEHHPYRPLFQLGGIPLLTRVLDMTPLSFQSHGVPNFSSTIQSATVDYRQG